MSEQKFISREKAISKWKHDLWNQPFSIDAINNQVWISGSLVEEFTFSHTSFSTNFFKATVATKRKSGVIDLIPVVAPFNLVNFEKNVKGNFVSINGYFYSRNRLPSEAGSRVCLYVYVKDISFYKLELQLAPLQDIDMVFLRGSVCKPPFYRTTPLNKQITELLLAVNQGYNTSYLMCITWGSVAQHARIFEIGDTVQILGRIQSRYYIKKLSPEHFEERITYEVSVQRLI